VTSSKPVGSTNAKTDEHGPALALPLDEGDLTLSLPGQDFDDLLERVIGPGARFVRLEGGEGMADAHRLIVGIAEGFGVVAGGIHEGFSTQQHSGDAAIFEGQDIVHTARYTGASVADGGDDEIATLGQFVDDGGVGNARIDEFGAMDGLGQAVFGGEPRRHVL
jgi:hypothetical protein